MKTNMKTCTNQITASCKIQAYSKKELCELYQIHRSTLKKWLHCLIQQGKIDFSKRIFTPKEVQLIFEEIGEP